MTAAVSGAGAQRLVALPVRDLADAAAHWDAVVVGSGVTGLQAALGLAAAGGRRVALLTKGRLGRDGASAWAQGGVAAAVAEEDSPALHAADTLDAGAGLCDEGVVDGLVHEGPGRLRRLIEAGARFDRDADGALLLGREAAHRRRRILHANGDATGAEMVRALVAAVRREPAVTLYEETFALDLALDAGRVVGVVARHPDGHRDGQRDGDLDGREVFHRAAAVVLACGGSGQLYDRTTNPPFATGDGVAMAARAGARLADLELVQFHPTALAAGVPAGGGTALPLVTEALRGEGAVLLDAAGHRFMTGVHPAAELAPRDVVARAIEERRARGEVVVLDTRAAVGRAFPRRFPTVWRHCRAAGIDPRREPIPVTTAAHYAMGGVVVDERGRASLPGLWAGGETAASGVHGANRLASNSLLEALVWGARIAEDVAATGGPRHAVGDAVVRREAVGGDADADAVAAAVRRGMGARAGLVRDRESLDALLADLARLDVAVASQPSPARNLVTVARLVASAARLREESRGAHFRRDFPEPREAFRCRLAWTYDPAAGELPIVPAAAPAVDVPRPAAEIA